MLSIISNYEYSMYWIITEIRILAEHNQDICQINKHLFFFVQNSFAKNIKIL